MSNRTSTKIWALRFAVLVVILAAAVSLWSGRAPGTLRVWFADVGQGDGIVIRTPSQETIVVDGGPRQDFVQEVDSHVPVTDRAVDLLVATHADADHITGLVGLVESGRVVNALINRDATKQTKVYQHLLAALAKQEVNVIEAQAGQEYTFGEVRVRVLWPSVAGLAAAKESNEKSIVLRVSYGSQDLLLTGDAPDTVEKQLLQQGSALDAEVLKVGHHGSKYSSIAVFLQAVSPDIAIVSVGAKNRYGHPASRVLADLEKLGIEVLRTDVLGDILVECSLVQCRTK
ncbi:MAG: MBL fold metallo-hydrolase [Patescibacteria group bacterium]